ncbi:hypothetical protein NOCA2770002 [metagenome]|uniref:Uncharacterized protein n=1 Tax=metagenome TaxID=256318 RepID=A0A2P2CEG9_9ZZZZ
MGVLLSSRACRGSAGVHSQYRGCLTGELRGPGSSRRTYAVAMGRLSCLTRRSSPFWGVCAGLLGVTMRRTIVCCLPRQNVQVVAWDLDGAAALNPLHAVGPAKEPPTDPSPVGGSLSFTPRGEAPAPNVAKHEGAVRSRRPGGCDVDNGGGANGRAS